MSWCDLLKYRWQNWHIPAHYGPLRNVSTRTLEWVSEWVGMWMSEFYVVFNQNRWGEKCLPVDETLLSNKALRIVSRHFAMKPWLTHMEAWRTKRDRPLSKTRVTSVWRNKGYTRPSYLCLTLSSVTLRDSRGCSDGDSSSSAGDMDRSSALLLGGLRALFCRDRVWAHPPREALLHGHWQRLRRVLNHAALLAWKVHGHQRVLRDAPLKLQTNTAKISLCSRRMWEDFPFQGESYCFLSFLIWCSQRWRAETFAAGAVLPSSASKNGFSFSIS